MLEELLIEDKSKDTLKTMCGLGFVNYINYCDDNKLTPVEHFYPVILDEKDFNTFATEVAKINDIQHYKVSGGYLFELKKPDREIFITTKRGLELAGFDLTYTLISNIEKYFHEELDTEDTIRSNKYTMVQVLLDYSEWRLKPRLVKFLWEIQAGATYLKKWRKLLTEKYRLIS